MTTQMVIGGWNVTLTQEFQIKQKSPDDFIFSKIFCIGHAHWNEQPVYVLLSGGTRSILKIYKNIEEMREDYRDHIADTWTAF